MIRPAIIGGDVVALGTLLGAAEHVLPDAAGIAAIIWYALQIYESRTARRWRERHHKETPHGPESS